MKEHHKQLTAPPYSERAVQFTTVVQFWLRYSWIAVLSLEFVRICGVGAGDRDGCDDRVGCRVGCVDRVGCGVGAGVSDMGGSVGQPTGGLAMLQRHAFET